MAPALAPRLKGAYSAWMSMLLLHLGSAASDDAEQTLLLARALRDTGHEALLACPRHSPLSTAARQAELPLVELKNAGLPLVWTLYRLIRQRDVRLLHTLDPGALAWAALLRRHYRELRLVHTLFTAPENGKKLRGRSIQQLDAVVCAGTELAGLAHANGVPDAKIRVILPAARPAAPGRACSAFLDAHPRERFIFVAAGALTPAADHAGLIQAMAYLQTMGIEDLPQWEVRIVGEGPLFDSLLESAGKLGVLDRLSLIGGQDRRVFLEAADAALCCDSEGRGSVSVILDAWSCGVPVACTALAAHRDLGEDKTSVLLSSPANPVALAGAMLRLMQEPSLRERLVAGGHAALEGFRPSRLGAEYAALYDEVLNAGAPVPSAGPSASAAR